MNACLSPGYGGVSGQGLGNAGNPSYGGLAGGNMAGPAKFNPGPTMAARAGNSSRDGCYHSYSTNTPETDINNCKNKAFALTGKFYFSFI